MAIVDLTPVLLAGSAGWPPSGAAAQQQAATRVCCWVPVLQERLDSVTAWLLALQALPAGFGRLTKPPVLRLSNSGTGKLLLGPSSLFELL